MSSIAFIPDVVSQDVPYATTSNPFYHIKNYLDETKYNANNTFKAQSDWGKSNVVAMNYRLNPEDANVDAKRYMVLLIVKSLLVLPMTELFF